MDSMTKHARPLLTLLALLAACDDGTSPADPDATDAIDQMDPGGDVVEGACGDQICNLNQTCDQTNVEPVCRCLEGHVGDDCTACATGWQRDGAGGCEPGELDCTTQPFACLPNGMCVLEGGASRCECTEGYDGRFCETCAEGYQDHAGPGLCQPGCALAGLSCSAPQLCDDATGTPRCACPRGTTGEACELCAAGYRRGDEGACVATCAVASLACESPQVCVEGTQGAACGCPRGSTGADCGECAAGWVATDVGCSPGCAALAELGACQQGTCTEDAAGVASCACEVGFAGPSCTACAFGHIGASCELCDTNFLRLADGPCQPACVYHDDACPGDSHCWDQDTMQAECLCDAGYTGPGCTRCDTGFVADGARCVPQLAADEDMLLTVGHDGLLHLAALTTSTGTLRLLRQVEGQAAGAQTLSSGVAIDPDTGELVAIIGSALGSIDLTTGAFTELAANLGINAHALTLAGDGTLYGQIGRDIVTLDRTTGAATVLHSLEATYPSIDGLAWRESTSTLLVLASRELFELDPATSTLTSLITFDDGFAVYPADVAVAANGDLLITGWRGGDGFAQGARHCRVQAWRLTGDAAYLDAPGVQLDSDGTTPLVVQSSGAEPRVIDLGINGNDEIRIETSNPGDVVCVHPWVSDSTPTLRLTAGAQIGAVLIDRHQITLDVEAGFAPATTPVLHMPAPETPAELEPTLEPHLDLVRLYSDDDWEQRGLAVAIGSGLPNDAHHAAVVRLNATASSVLEVIELPGVTVDSIEPIPASAP